jgi:predicted metal-binding membrane protein
VATPSSANESMKASWSSPHRPAKALPRDRLILLALLAVVTAGAWALTAYQATTMDMPMGVVPRSASVAPDAAAPPDDMGDMDAMGGMAMDEAADTAAMGMAGAGWSLAGFVAFLIAWAVMMAAMMFPAAAPMILLFHAMAARRKAAGRAFVPTWVFVVGYLLVWTSIGGITWLLVQVASDVAGQVGPVDRLTWAPLALGMVLVLAGLYQLTPLKRVCLEHCRSPFGFVMTHWREGYGGALQMGVIHGFYCLGCCWALFAVLVAAGVMSLAWMLLLTFVVFAEKVLPVGPRVAQATGLALLVLGVIIAVGTVDLPWTAH